MVLTFGYSGVQSLESILAQQPSLACTSGTGVIPLCAQVVATWKQVEQNNPAMSALAASSVRALAGSMITSILAASAGRRWCEVATARASTADTFATVFPQAQFVCFYRACDHVIAAAAGASRWGLIGAGIGDFVTTYPGNSVAALAAYWFASASALLDFETAYPGRTLRVRQEDLAASREATTNSITEFLGLSLHRPGLPSPLAEPKETGMTAEQPDVGKGQEIPIEMIPGPMLEQVNHLHGQLGYPALAPPTWPKPPPDPVPWLAAHLREGPGPGR